ncbi:MAG TPA: hypothetical protein VHE79_00635 [Spirochaetia bacterium]
MLISGFDDLGLLPETPKPTGVLLPKLLPRDDEPSGLEGQRIGKLAVHEHVRGRGHRCICDCGEETYVAANLLKRRQRTSCGCSQRKPAYDLTGERFGFLRAVSWRVGEGWTCVCDCGREVVVPTKDLMAGNKKSCGCGGRGIAGRAA